MKISETYFRILRKCKFIAKPNTWFIEGSLCKLEGDPFREYSEGDIFSDNSGLFCGPYIGPNGKEKIDDRESCSLAGFFVYDEWGNEISNLTFMDYIRLLRSQKIRIIEEWG